MKLITVKDYDAMSEAAAEIIMRQIDSKPNSVIGFSTGSTPTGTYKQLTAFCAQGRVSFKNVVPFNLDEYVGLAPDDPNSYVYYMKENLFDHIDIDPANTHIPNGAAEDLEAECRRYDALLERYGSIDLQLVGIGQNGHIGFNEPSDTFSDKTQIAKLSENTRAVNAAHFRSADAMPQFAITMGVGDIMRAKRIILMVNGAHKAQILDKVMHGEITPQVPASILQRHDDVTVIATQDAFI
ncbi:glucosamine-6-phosphate deaminase [Oscillospiraceae bacterium LTW-04]|nr:glucosamine-6-phosphate deaminase [Oscillospiraceae bacterium MB24-C1]